MKNDNDSRRSLTLRWTCDKKGCGHANIRHVMRGDVIFEDTCDGCNRMVHEPITKILKESTR